MYTPRYEAKQVAAGDFPPCARSLPASAPMLLQHTHFPFRMTRLMMDNSSALVAEADADPAQATDVRDNFANGRFEVEVDGVLAFATYERQGSTITFIHTFVPEALRGQGIASRIIFAALASSRAKVLRLVPRCPMFRAYMACHMETLSLLAPEGVALISA